MTIVIGYNKPRPTEEDYTQFIEIIVDGLEPYVEKGVSLMAYGSFTRPQDFVPGRSDIDALLLTRDNVVTDKKLLRNVSKVLAYALEKHYVPFQISVSDIATMMDGRFNTYDLTFEEYFREEGKIFAGPDYRNTFAFQLPIIPSQAEVLWGLRKARQQLLFAEYNLRNDYPAFLKGFEKTLQTTSRGSKQLLYMVDGKFRVEKCSALETVAEIFPKVNPEPLRDIKWLYTHPAELDRIYKIPKISLEIMNQSLTFLEEMIREYIALVPK